MRAILILSVVAGILGAGIWAGCGSTSTGEPAARPEAEIKNVFETLQRAYREKDGLLLCTKVFPPSTYKPRARQILGGGDRRGNDGADDAASKDDLSIMHQECARRFERAWDGHSPSKSAVVHLRLGPIELDGAHATAPTLNPDGSKYGTARFVKEDGTWYSPVIGG